MQAVAETRTSTELARMFASIINPDTGIISRVVHWNAGGKPVGLPVGASAVLRRPSSPEIGYGKGLSAEEALVGAVGEALEMHASSSCQVGTLPHATVEELDGEVLHPQQLCLYEDAYYDLPGFPYARFHKQAIHWVRGSWLGSENAVWVPALPTFRALPAPFAERFCQVTSNGLATGLGPEDAAVRAALELIERDAFMLSWYCRLPGRELDIEGCLEPGTEKILQDITSCGAETKLWLLDAGIPVPTVVCVARGNGVTWPGATLGLGTHPSPKIAVRKAILELGQTGPTLSDAMLKGEEPVPATPGEVRTFRQHALFYLPAERNHAFDFLSSSPDPPLRVSNVLEAQATSPGQLAMLLKQAGVRIAIVDLTTPDLRDTPFRVVRAIGTDMQQIHCGYGRERSRNPRLWQLLKGTINLGIPPVC